MRVLIAQPEIGALTETFLSAHANLLPCQVSIVSNMISPELEGTPLLSRSFTARTLRRVVRTVGRRSRDWEVTIGLIRAIQRVRAQVVLAQYGPVGTQVLEACRQTDTPLVVHFHGYDASRTDVINGLRSEYTRLFQSAAAVIAPSRAMVERLTSLGCPIEKLRYSPYGVDCASFRGGEPGSVEPTFLAVGRFVPKKAPHLTLLAFARVVQHTPTARLRFIGDGPLLGVCRDIATSLNLSSAVSFLGPQSPEVVREEMRRARCFVQHSIEAWDGDCEGTPVAILEAAATGLPVIATRHGGIPDVVLDGTTGLLVDERNVVEMARCMQTLAEHPCLAKQLGTEGRSRIIEHFNISSSIERLRTILKDAAESSRSKSSTRAFIASNEIADPSMDTDSEPKAPAPLP